MNSRLAVTGRSFSRSILQRGGHGIPVRPVPRTPFSRHLSSERGGMTEAMYNWRVAAVENALKKMGKETGRERCFAAFHCFVSKPQFPVWLFLNG